MDDADQVFLSRHEALVAEHRRLREEAEGLCAEIRRQIEHLQWLVDSIRREWQAGFFRPLQDAIRAVHACESRHVATFAVRKILDGQVLWLGMVEEFVLDGALGTTCYAWQYAEDGQPRTFTVLKQGPVDSPQAAVQLFLLAKSVSPTALLA